MIILIVLLFIINYSFLNSALIQIFEDSETGLVERVIDGDTIKINGESIRLLGINSPEKSEYFYFESKQFLENQILNKEVQIHFGKTKYDKYYRKLGYVFYEGRNINLESVKQGYSNYYFPSGKDKYYLEFVGAWNSCLNKGKNLCKKSKEECIVLNKWDVGEQIVILKNICSNDVNLTGWSIKDEGRKKYIFENKILGKGEEIILTPKDWKEEYVWTKSGDSLILRDTNYEIILFESY